MAADVDGDKIADFFIGKRYWVHLDVFGDADHRGPAYLILYHGRRDPKAPGGIRFHPEVIDDRSGAGANLTVGDIDKDGRVDVISAGVFGTRIFWGTKGKR